MSGVPVLVPENVNEPEFTQPENPRDKQDIPTANAVDQNLFLYPKKLDTTKNNQKRPRLSLFHNRRQQKQKKEAFN
jgi:hypothetical protein